MRYKIHLSDKAKSVFLKLPRQMRRWLYKSICILESNPELLEETSAPTLLPEYFYFCDRPLPNGHWDFFAYVDLRVARPDLTYLDVKHISETFTPLIP